MKYKKTTLKNGLRILTVPMQGTQTATVMLMVGVGSRFETEKQAGISHFIEHMLFKGTEKRPNTLVISEELDSIGGEFNAFTSKDKTAYYAKTDAKHFAKALDVISDMYLNSKLEKEEIERERGTILQELSMYEDEPRRSVGDEFEKLLYAKQTLGREIVGSKETIKSVLRKDFVAYMNKYYTAKETVVCVAGKFNEKEAIKLVERQFRVLKAGSRNVFKKVVEKQREPEVQVKFKKTDQSHLVLGARAYHQNHPDRYALALLSVILGGNMSSRIFIEVRERRGLAYSVHTSVDTYQDCGYIATQAGVEHKNLEKTIEVIMQEYKKISEELVSSKELQKAKDYIKGKSIMGFEASDDVAVFFIDQEMHREKILTPEEVFAKIDKVTEKDILRVAKDTFKSQKMNLAIIGPHKNATKIKKFLTV